ncbi:Cof-type HAD-IIB family hydrolase [Butyrivibrio fibrisolvens]|uniref:Cof-type HAD-IIB family hydrolase n=1 Tax=Butyrivibrio fibrisolvens TaxID=831 RepID=UPI000558BD3E|nr:Cof-type HAD-IIB family hydrolase [Butyrivibrio fibrisolvens]
MGNVKIVFSDIDGTLLNSRHRMLDSTHKAIMDLQKSGIPFVIVTARGPSGVRPIFKRYGFVCPMICYSGALIIDENDKIVHSEGFGAEDARSIISYIEESGFDCTWNIYSEELWIVNDRSDKRIRVEEEIVEVDAQEGSIDLLPEGAIVGKLLCMCEPEAICHIEDELKKRFPKLSIVKSSDILLEVMGRGITKASGIERVCTNLSIPLESAAAFGDHYNDAQMLRAVGMPFLMGNAPKDMQKEFECVIGSNDEPSIYNALKGLGIITC